MSLSGARRSALLSILFVIELYKVRSFVTRIGRGRGTQAFGGAGLRRADPLGVLRLCAVPAGSCALSGTRSLQRRGHVSCLPGVNPWDTTAFADAIQEARLTLHGPEALIVPSIKNTHLRKSLVSFSEANRIDAVVLAQFRCGRPSRWSFRIDGSSTSTATSMSMTTPSGQNFGLADFAQLSHHACAHRRDLLYMQHGLEAAKHEVHRRWATNFLDEICSARSGEQSSRIDEGKQASSWELAVQRLSNAVKCDRPKESAKTSACRFPHRLSLKYAVNKIGNFLTGSQA